jgi:hypothetical protein
MFKKLWKYLVIFITGVLSVLAFILVPKKSNEDTKEIESIEDKIDRIISDKEEISDDIKNTADKIEKLKKIKIGTSTKDQVSIEEAIDYLHKIGRK